MSKQPPWAQYGQQQVQYQDQPPFQGQPYQGQLYRGQPFQSRPYQGQPVVAGIVIGALTPHKGSGVHG